MSIVTNNPYEVGDCVEVADGAAPTIYNEDGTIERDYHGVVVEVLGDCLVAIKHDRYSNIRDYHVREVRPSWISRKRAQDENLAKIASMSRQPH